MYDVALYGHITLDRIFNDFKKDQTIGSIGNVWKHLNKLNPLLSLYIEPTDVGEALIFINQKTSERASIANLSLFTKSPTLKKSNWSHILYLNQLEDPSFIRDIQSRIISADICRGEPIKDLEVLRDIDFLFLSDEDEFLSPKDILKFVKIGLILHDPSGSTYYGKDGTVLRNKVEIVDNVNVLGCGDMLAAGFINYYLLQNDIGSSLRRSHEEITKVLMNQKRRASGNA